MALFSRGGPPPAPREGPGPQELGSPAFGHLVERLEREPERKYGILDLGPASGNHIEFFSRFRCRFHVASLEENLAEWIPEEEQPPPDPEALLPLAGEESLDLILCWDLLNYLEPTALPLLAGHLRHHCAEGAWLHAFIHTTTRMPERPGRFQLLEASRMRWRHGSGETSSPRYAARVLEKLLPGFRLDQSRLLQNGLQEYLFRAR